MSLIYNITENLYRIYRNRPFYKKFFSLDLRIFCIFIGLFTNCSSKKFSPYLTNHIA